MEKLITKVILGAFFAIFLVSGVFIVWVLRGRPRSFWSEFNESNTTRNGVIFLVLLAAVIAGIIYVNNR